MVRDGTKRDAEKYLNETLVKRDLGGPVEPSRLTLSEYLDRWLRDAVAPRVRPRTLAGYKRHFDSHVRPALEIRPLAKLTPLDLQKFYTDIAENF